MYWKIKKAIRLFRSNHIILICDKGYYSSVSKEFGDGFFKDAHKLLKELEAQHMAQKSVKTPKTLNNRRRK